MTEKGDDSGNEGSKKFKSFTAYDVQKVRLEKLFNNIEKPVEIPTRKTSKNFANAPEFVRNVMGSSAGAGSGEFHVYRHLRRKEYARLHNIETAARNEQLDADYHRKLEENRKKAEELTEKKRAKRQKKKEKLKNKKKVKKETTDSEQQKEDASEEKKEGSNDEEDKED